MWNLIRASLYLSQRPPHFRKYERGLDLTIRNRPVLPEQAILFFFRHHAEAMFTVKADSPGCRFPGTDKDRLFGELVQMGKELGANAATAECGTHVRVADQRDI